ncbi:MAG TPA: MFS transporter, partial [Azospira sp.]|nr:MFS transporter [Azospira sp.]
MPVFLRALNSRNYRLYFAGQLISLAGTWMQQIAMAWLAYRLSNSAFVLGTVGFASQIPILLFAALGGVWTDRFDRRRLLLLTQTLAMIQALILATLAWLEWVTPGLLILLAFALGCINALDVPARQAIAVQLVDDKADLPNAIALNSFLMNSARFVGPALAGFLVALVGEAVCFLLNAVSYLAVLLALRAIRLPLHRGGTAPAVDALKEGIRYVLAHRQIRRSLLLVACVSFLATPYAVMMPLFAKEIFGGDARTFGLLIGSAGAGSLMASFYLASRKDMVGLG